MLHGPILKMRIYLVIPLHKKTKQKLKRKMKIKTKNKIKTGTQKLKTYTPYEIESQ